MFRRKRSDTEVGTLRRKYGDDFAPEFRSDAHLSTVLQETGAESLSQLLRRKGNGTMAAWHKVFISFAIEDRWAKEYLIGQAKNNKSPFTFTDMSINEPFSEKWKTQCREVIKGCDGVIALISKRTRNADGARWEIRCAVEERIPLIGVHISADDKGAIPTELQGKRIIEWTWPGIANFLDRL